MAKFVYSVPVSLLKNISVWRNVLYFLDGPPIQLQGSFRVKLISPYGLESAVNPQNIIKIVRAFFEKIEMFAFYYVNSS